MAFIRPNAAEALRRWMPAAIGLAVLAFGLVTLMDAVAIGDFVGLVLGAVASLLGAAVLFTSVQRARLPSGGGGPGMVEITERRVIYFSPTGGETISVDQITCLEIIVARQGRYWRIHTPETRVDIPVSASGAEHLVDAFAPLADLSYERVLAALAWEEPGVIPIWRKQRSPAMRLHH